MQAYQVVAIAVMIAMGYVVHVTLKLNNFRKQAGVVRTAVNLRDLAVLRQPQKFDPEERKLVRNSWLACAALLILVLVMLNVLPEDVIQKMSVTLSAPGKG